MSVSIEDKNKAIVLQAFDTLFNQRDYSRAERFWSPRYIQHSDHIRPGRDGLFELVRDAPATMRYENHLILANGDFLMLHGHPNHFGFLRLRPSSPALRDRSGWLRMTGACGFVVHNLSSMTQAFYRVYY